jgi:hypothetical protein
VGCGAAPSVVLLDFGRSTPCTSAWEMEEEEEQLRALLAEWVWWQGGPLDQPTPQHHPACKRGQHGCCQHTHQQVGHNIIRSWHKIIRSSSCYGFLMVYATLYAACCCTGRSQRPTRRTRPAVLLLAWWAVRLQHRC